MSTTQPGEFTGRHMWMLTIGFFGVIIAVNVGLAVVSSTSWTGLVVENSYVASQEFEGKRLDHEAQAAAGWDAKFTYADGVTSLTVEDATGARVDLGAVTLDINRPVGGHEDQHIALLRTYSGQYSAPAELAAGIWEVHVIAPATSKGFFELNERFRVEVTPQ